MVKMEITKIALLVFITFTLINTSCITQPTYTKEELASSDKLLNKGREYYAEDKVITATMVFNKLLELYSDRDYDAAWAQYEIGMCYYLRKDYDKAVESFEKVIRNYPNIQEPKYLATQLIRKINTDNAHKRSSYGFKFN